MKDTQLIKTYCSVGLIASAISLFWLVIESKVPLASWLSGVSRFLILLVLVNGTGLVIFFILAWKSWRDERWSERIAVKIRGVLAKRGPGMAILASSLYGLFLGIIFLYSIETRTSFRISPGWVDRFETLRALMNRVEPLVFWFAVLFLMHLLVLGALGFGTAARYERVIRPFAFLIIPVLLVVVYGIERLDERYFREIFKEDNLLEWLTFWLLLLTGMLGGILAWRARRAGHKSFWFLALFGLFFVLFAMEEISWGQRLLQVESTQFFLENSDQQEINIHNVLQNWLAFRTNRVAGVVLFVYGALLPFVPHRSWLKRLMDRFGVVVPGRVLALGFVLAALLMLPGLSGREEELGELFFSICLFLFILLEHLTPGLQMAKPQPVEPSIPV